MTTHDSAAQAAPSPPVAERRLARSRDNRVIAGVCGGLGRYCGVDPLLFRIGLAVLVLFGGAGAVIYLAAWLFLPADGDAASPVEALLGRGHSSTSMVTTVILAVIAIITVGVVLHGRSVLILALAVLGILLLARRGPAPAGPATPPAPPGADGPDAGGATPYEAVPAAYAPHGPYGGSVGGAPPTQATATMTVPLPPTGQKAPKPPKEHSALGRLVVFAILIVMGVLLAVDRLLDVSIPGSVYVAIALVMVGSGLVAGAWMGRSRALIAVGLLLCVALPVSSAAGGWDGPGGHVGDQRWEPVTAASVEPAYDVGFGEGTLDLTSVDFTDQTVTTGVEVGFGHLVVYVPRNVDVTVTADAGAGDLRLFGQETNGSDVHRTVTDLGADGAGGGQLKLNAEVGFGAMEVIRE